MSWAKKSVEEGGRSRIIQHGTEREGCFGGLSEHDFIEVRFTTGLHYARGTLPLHRFPLLLGVGLPTR